MRWYTGLIQFNVHPDGDTRTPELIHVEANSPSEARQKVYAEHQRQVNAAMNGETYIDSESGEEYEYEVFVPEGLGTSHSYRDCGPELFFLFEGKLTNLY